MLLFLLDFTPSILTHSVRGGAWASLSAGMKSPGLRMNSSLSTEIHLCIAFEILLSFGLYDYYMPVLCPVTSLSDESLCFHSLDGWIDPPAPESTCLTLTGRFLGILHCLSITSSLPYLGCVLPHCCSYALSLAAPAVCRLLARLELSRTCCLQGPARTACSPEHLLWLLGCYFHHSC